MHLLDGFGHDPRIRATLLRMVTRVAQTLCGLRGHAAMLHFRPGRLCLECLLCGRQTPGWEVGTSRASSSMTKMKRPSTGTNGPLQKAARGDTSNLDVSDVTRGTPRQTPATFA